MTERKGDWIQTFTKKKFYPFDPREEEIDIIDIAHALSNICRFTGHCRRFYSVAEHSVYVANKCFELGDTKTALFGLLHDASEAYIADIASPVKRNEQMKFYRVLEKELQKIIYNKFGLLGPAPDLVKEIDLRMLATEGKWLFYNINWGIIKDVKPFDDIIIDDTRPMFAKYKFLELFYKIINGCIKKTDYEVIK